LTGAENWEFIFAGIPRMKFLFMDRPFEWIFASFGKIRKICNSQSTRRRAI